MTQLRELAVELAAPMPEMIVRLMKNGIFKTAIDELSPEEEQLVRDWFEQPPSQAGGRGPDGQGSSGVREPRRPKPGAPTDTIALPPSDS